MIKKTKIADQRTLFLAVVLLVFLWLAFSGSMVDYSGDAADIWKTITTYYTADRYGSYVMYKGIASVYPYVWLYQLAMLLKLNEFFFVWLYHALLFAYVSVYGIPTLVEHLLQFKAHLWQRLLMPVALFWLWGPSHALDQVMVDLPSCAFFFLAVHCAIHIETAVGKKRGFFVLATSLFAGLCANISGQYSLAAVCVLLFAFLKIWQAEKNTEQRNIARLLISAVVLCAGMLAFKVANSVFWSVVVTPLNEEGYNIATAQTWMERAFIYMMDIGRMFVGTKIRLLRGEAIVQDIYGPEKAAEIVSLASAGGFGWSMKEYLKAVIQYPVDFLINWFDRGFLAISIDFGKHALGPLVASYTMFFMAIYSAVKRVKTVKNFFCAELWLILGALASIIPPLVMCIEFRYALTLQGLIIGTAILGDQLILAGQSAKKFFRTLVLRKGTEIGKMDFPWAFALWLVFVLLCLAHIGGLYAQSDVGTDMLFSKWL